MLRDASAALANAKKMPQPIIWRQILVEPPKIELAKDVRLRCRQLHHWGLHHSSGSAQMVGPHMLLSKVQGSSQMNVFIETDNPAASEREHLILDHLRQVKLIARRIHDRLPGNV